MLLKNRFQAFATHLAGSALVGILCAAVVFAGWYAWPLALAAGAPQIFGILLAVDVVVGPLITLIVFNPKKKELKRDLAVVLLLQVAALAYGLHTMYIARPVYMVFAVDRFELVYANDLTEEKLAKVTDPAFKSVPVWGTKTVAAHRPDDREARQKLMFDALAGGDDLHQLPQYFEPYERARAQVVAKVQDLAQLSTFNSPESARVEKLKATYAERAGFLPLRGSAEDLSVVVDRSTGQILEIARLKPWSF